jgi:hypothetical protein
VRGRAVVRLLIVLIAVASMLLAPVVTWPRSGGAGHGLSTTLIASSCFFWKIS